MILEAAKQRRGGEEYTDGHSPQVEIRVIVEAKVITEVSRNNIPVAQFSRRQDTGYTEITVRGKGGGKAK